MHAWLAQHPEIFMSPIKEPGHFGSDLVPGTEEVRITHDNYLALFNDTGDEPVVGEASTSYIHSQRAAEEIGEFAPGARILIQLRNPVEMVWSHNRLLRHESLAEALEREPGRAAAEPGWAVREGVAVIFEQLLLYRALVAGLPAAIERFQVQFPGRVKLLLLDDLRANPASDYREVLEFLDISTDHAPEFAIHKPTQGVRSETLARLLRLADSGLGWFYRPLYRLLGLRGLGIWDYNRAPPPEPLDPQLRQRLTQEFAPVVRELEQLAGRDLSAWRDQRF